MFTLLLLTSKGMAGIGGAALVVIATSLAATGVIPVAGMALILGIERIQNEVRTLLNMMGNVLAGIVIARSENEFDLDHARRVLDGEIHPHLDEEPVKSRSNPSVAKAS
jgi:aerobic C4-dicarboxylate transport protein